MIPAEQKSRWKEILFIEANGEVHPLIHDDVMVFHFIKDFGQKYVRNLGQPDQEIIPLADMKKEFETAIDSSNVGHVLEWEKGDVIFVDNRHVAHKGYDFHQNPLTGLRILDVTEIEERANPERKLNQKSSSME